MISGVVLLIFLSPRKLSINLLLMEYGYTAKIIQSQQINVAILITWLKVKPKFSKISGLLGKF